MTPEFEINNGAVAPVVVEGGAYQYQVPITLPGSIAGSGTFTSPLLPSLGMPHIAVAAELTQTGSIVVDRFLDNAGSIALTAITQALTANTLAILDNNDGKLFQSFTVGLVNTGTVAATPSDVIVVLQSR